MSDLTSPISTASISTKPLHHRHRRHNPSFPPLHLPSRKTLTLSAAKSQSQSQTQPLSKTLKSRLRNNETLYGIFLLSFSPTIAEISGLSGFDFAVVDMEHGHGSISDSLQILRALSSTQTPAILRLPESSPTWAKKALDLGPQGLMFPMIHTPAQARDAVSFCRYPPRGVRGAAHPVVRASGWGLNEGYLAEYEEDLLIMCQVESEEGAEMAAEIAAVEGVDCVQMGPLDLSASMGCLWDPGNRKVREVMGKAEKGVLESGGAWLAGFGIQSDPPEEMARRGYNMVSGTVDVALFRAAAVENVRSFKRSLMELNGGDDVGDQGKDGDDKYWSE